MPLVIYSLRGGHAHKHTHTLMCEPKQFQETQHTCGLRTPGLINVEFYHTVDLLNISAMNKS